MWKSISECEARVGVKALRDVGSTNGVLKKVINGDSWLLERDIFISGTLRGE